MVECFSKPEGSIARYAWSGCQRRLQLPRKKIFSTERTAHYTDPVLSLGNALTVREPVRQAQSEPSAILRSALLWMQAHWWRTYICQVCWARLARKEHLHDSPMAAAPGYFLGVILYFARTAAGKRGLADARSLQQIAPVALMRVRRRRWCIIRSMPPVTLPT